MLAPQNDIFRYGLPTTFAQRFAWICALTAMFALTACGGGGASTGTDTNTITENGNTLTFSDSTQLQGKYKNNNSDAAPAGNSSGALLTLVGEVDSPTVNGVTLGATGVAIRGDLAYVGYNTRGEPYGGSVQHINLDSFNNPEVDSQVNFSARDINDVTVCALSGGTYRLYLAMSAEGTGAAVGYINLNSSMKITKNPLVEVALSGPAANSVRCSGTTVIVTHGTGGGVTVFDKDLAESSRTHYALTDARSVDFWGSNYAALGVESVTNGTITTIVDGAVSGTVTLGGGTTPAESKAVIEVTGNTALAALDEGGVVMVDLTSGTTLDTLPISSSTGGAIVSANSVTANKDLLFVAEGEAGVVMAKLDASIGNSPSSIQKIGILNLGGGISANDVQYRNSALFVAAGVGGFKIIKVSGGGYDTDSATYTSDKESSDAD